MIFVPRPVIDPVDVVDALAKPFPKDLKSELERARAYYAQKPAPTKAYDFKRYKEWAVCKALDDLFHEKCAYCESSYRAVDARDVEHFRPKGGIPEAPGHRGYWWLAAIWSNLLPSCPPCNQLRHHTIFDPGMTLEEFEKARQKEPESKSGKASSFPVANGKWVMEEDGDLTAEDPLLINPAVRDPSKHLEWTFDWDRSKKVWEAKPVFPVVRPRSVAGTDDPYGKASIAIYGLNRSGLLRERMDLIGLIQGVCPPIVDLMSDLAEMMPRGVDISKQIARLTNYKANLRAFTAPERPYAGMASAFVNLLDEEFARAGSASN
jgi:hypothetical protein